MTRAHDGLKDRQNVFRVYASDDHLLIIGNMVEADSHFHRFLHVIVSLEDDPAKGLDITVDGRVLNCKGIIINSDVVHAFHGRNADHALVLVDHTSQLGRCLKDHFLPDGAPHHVFPLGLSLALAHEIAQIPQGKLPPLAYQNHWHRVLFLLDLAHCSLFHRKCDERVARILAYMKKPGDRPHSLKALAEQIHLSPSRLSHLFVESTGGTLKNYILFNQLLQALCLIAEGESATMAALESGFDTSSHFSSTCKRLIGLQPGSIRKVSCFLKVSMFQ